MLIWVGDGVPVGMGHSSPLSEGARKRYVSGGAYGTYMPPIQIPLAPLSNQDYELLRALCLHCSRARLKLDGACLSASLVLKYV